jgi:ABC-type multidrug transport system permease subunit
MAQVRTFSIILGIIILAPFTYVAIFGRNLPFWFWIVAVLVITYSTHSVIRRIRGVKESKKT